MSTLTAAEYRTLKGLDQPEPKRKYRNRIVYVDDLRFDSKAEAEYYGLLKIRMEAGEVKSFDCQVDFPCIVNGEVVCVYRADFVLYLPDGSMQVVDVKGVRKGAAWQLFRLKQKLLKAATGMEIIVV